MNDAKLAYDTTHCECLSLVRAMLLLDTTWTVLDLPSPLIKTRLSGSENFWTWQENLAAGDNVCPNLSSTSSPARIYRASNSWRFIATKSDRSQSNANQRLHTRTHHYHLCPSENAEATVLYMQDYAVLNDNEGTEIPALHAIVTLTDIKHDKRQITLLKIIYDPAKDSYFRQASSIVGLPGFVLY